MNKYWKEDFMKCNEPHLEPLVPIFKYVTDKGINSIYVKYSKVN